MDHDKHKAVTDITVKHVLPLSSILVCITSGKIHNTMMKNIYCSSSHFSVKEL